jgi:hypothetical protein
MKPILGHTVTADTNGEASDVSGSLLDGINFYACRISNQGSVSVAVNEPGLAASATDTGVIIAAGGRSELLGPFKRTILDATGTNSVRLTTASGTSACGVTWYALSDGEM